MFSAVAIPLNIHNAKSQLLNHVNSPHTKYERRKKFSLCSIKDSAAFTHYICFLHWIFSTRIEKCRTALDIYNQQPKPLVILFSNPCFIQTFSNTARRQAERRYKIKKHFLYSLVARRPFNGTQSPLSEQKLVENEASETVADVLPFFILFNSSQQIRSHLSTYSIVC